MERLPDIVGAQLAKILQKPEQEMQFMLKRHSLLNKKNQKKTEMYTIELMGDTGAGRHLGSVEAFVSQGIPEASVQSMLRNTKFP